MTRPGRGRVLLLAAYALLCLGMIGWPGYGRFGNSIEPYVLGLPLSLAWNVGWVLLTFVVLLLFHAGSDARRGGGG